MTDAGCLLAGLVRLLTAPVLLMLWRRKTGARLLPAPIALALCFPVFLLGGGIRAGFDRNDALSYYVQQALLYGVLEEGVKFLALRFFLASCDSPKDAVTYGIGHSAFEELGAGISCLGLIGTGRAAPGIFWFNLWAALEGTVSVISLTILIFWGIRTGRSRVMLPAAMLLHAVGNFSHAMDNVIGIPASILLTAGAGYAAYRCWRAMREDYN